MRAALVLTGLAAAVAQESDPAGALPGNGEYTHGEVDFESQFYPDNLIEDYTFWLTNDNIMDKIDESIDSGKTLFIRFIASEG